MYYNRVESLNDHTNKILRLKQDFFPGFWEHDPNPWNWEIQRCFIKKWENIHDLNFAVIE
jgi:hypothetical protein